MLDYSQLNALRAVLQSGSFEAAAHKLNITPSAVSQRIKALEDRIGTPLVVRSSPVFPTPAGQRLFRHAQEVALLETTLSTELNGLGPIHPTPIRIVVNADSLDTWFIKAMANAEGFLFDISIDDQDFSAQWLRRGEVMAAVTAHPTPVQGCVSLAIGSLRYIATASPEFIQTYFNSGFTFATAKTAPMLKFNHKDESQHRWLATEIGKSVTPPELHLPTTSGFVEAACRGLGWGLNPEQLVQEKIKNGELKTLGKNPIYDVPLFWQINRVSADALKPLTKAVTKAAKLHLIQNSSTAKLS